MSVSQACNSLYNDLDSMVIPATKKTITEYIASMDNYTYNICPVNSSYWNGNYSTSTGTALIMKCNNLAVALLFKSTAEIYYVSFSNNGSSWSVNKEKIF